MTTFEEEIIFKATLTSHYIYKLNPLFDDATSEMRTRLDKLRAEADNELHYEQYSAGLVFEIMFNGPYNDITRREEMQTRYHNVKQKLDKARQGRLEHMRSFMKAALRKIILCKLRNAHKVCVLRAERAYKILYHF